MRSPRLRWSTLLPSLVVVLALLGIAAEGASLPHVHKSSTAGFFNEEHDLTNLATFRGGAPVPEGAPAISVVLVALPVAADAVSRPPETPRRHADSRAPPAPLA